MMLSTANAVHLDTALFFVLPNSNLIEDSLNGTARFSTT